MIYSIVLYGNEILRQKAEPLKIGSDVEELIKNMLITMDISDGAGLAAPQIGKSIQLFTVDISYYFKDGIKHPYKYRKAYINPVIEILDPEIVYHEEGCLSMPGIYIPVPRNKKIRVKYFDRNWEPQEEELIDMPARIIQHEYDHLYGKLHIDYLDPQKRDLLKPKLQKISGSKSNLFF